MATADQIKALIRTHAEGDDERFYSVALQVAAQAARAGQTKLADELREVVDRAKARAGSAPSRLHPIPVTQPRGELASLLTVVYPRVRLGDMALDERVLSRLERVIREQRGKAQLQEHGLAPLRKLLLIGPPGTGKTLTASVLAGELGLPLFSIQLDGLITKFMGETASKLRVVFDAIQQSIGVYFFDEFDALGGERAAPNDVGEIRRALNSFLQFLEQVESQSLILAATNHPRLLDRALHRRFDAIIEYSLPSDQIAERIMRSRLTLLDTHGIDWKASVDAAKGLSQAEIVRACETAAKNAILNHSTTVDTAGIVDALRERQAPAP